jgi:pimeloyl-ACP methyl ester carboxylesterase
MRDVWRIGLGAAGVTSAAIAAQEWMARRYYASTLGPREFVDQDARAAWTAVWHELWAPLELATLHASSVYRGHGVPQGAGDPVVLVHGFLMRGRYLWPMQRWLRRLGYRAQIAGIGVNADCIDVMTDRLLRVVAGVSEEANGPVHLVGHSLGGLLARAVATRAREQVASVAVLGSPFRGLRMHPVVRAAAGVVQVVIRARRGVTVRSRCLTLACDCLSVRALHQPAPADMPQLAVVTRHDGLTDWRYCMDPSTTTVVGVSGSHVGLVWSPAAYRALADHLRRASPRLDAAHGDRNRLTAARRSMWNER